MARVKSAVTKRKRHKKILKQAKGYFGHKHIGFRSAKEQVRKSNEYAFRDRKQVKREMRKLWIKRINAAARMYEMSYSQFMNGLKKAEIEINRKMLADIAVHDLEQFGHLVNEAKTALGQATVKVAPIAKEEKATAPKKQTKPAPKPAKEEVKVEEVKEEAKVEEKVEEVKEEATTPVVEEAKTEEVKEEVKEEAAAPVVEEAKTEEVKEESTEEEVKEEAAPAEEAKTEESTNEEA